MVSQKSPKLDVLLKYNNSKVVRRFSSDYGLDLKTSRILFLDMLRFLWLCREARKQKKESVVMTSLWLPIDKMWHTFILFTPDYHAFSNKYFGEYFHHVPEDRPRKISKRAFLKKMELYMDFIYDELGEDVVNRWFVTYPKLKLDHKS